MRGGYLIIDLKGINFDTTKIDGTTIQGNVKGIHERIESNFYKPILLENFKVDGIEKQALYVINALFTNDNKLALEIGALNHLSNILFITIDIDNNLYLTEI